MTMSESVPDSTSISLNFYLALHESVSSGPINSKIWWSEKSTYLIVWENLAIRLVYLPRQTSTYFLDLSVIH